MNNKKKNTIDTLLQTQEAIRRQAEPLLSAVRVIEESAGLKRLVDEMNRSREAMRAALGSSPRFAG